MKHRLFQPENFPSEFSQRAFISSPSGSSGQTSVCSAPIFRLFPNIFRKTPLFLNIIRKTFPPRYVYAPRAPRPAHTFQVLCCVALSRRIDLSPGDVFYFCFSSPLLLLFFLLIPLPFLVNFLEGFPFGVYLNFRLIQLFSNIY